jgi:hypothetical protein
LKTDESKLTDYNQGDRLPSRDTKEFKEALETFVTTSVQGLTSDAKFLFLAKKSVAYKDFPQRAQDDGVGDADDNAIKQYAGCLWRLSSNKAKRLRFLIDESGLDLSSYLQAYETAKSDLLENLPDGYEHAKVVEQFLNTVEFDLKTPAATTKKECPPPIRLANESVDQTFQSLDDATNDMRAQVRKFFVSSKNVSSLNTDPYTVVALAQELLTLLSSLVGPMERGLNKRKSSVSGLDTKASSALATGVSFEDGSPNVSTRAFFDLFAEKLELDKNVPVEQILEAVLKLLRTSAS